MLLLATRHLKYLRLLEGSYKEIHINIKMLSDTATDNNIIVNENNGTGYLHSIIYTLAVDVRGHAIPAQLMTAAVIRGCSFTIHTL